MRPSKYLVRLAGAGVIFAALGFFSPWLFYLQAAYNITLLILLLIDFAVTPRPHTLTLNRIVPEKQYLRVPLRVTLLLKNNSSLPLTYQICDHTPLEFSTDTQSLSGEIKPRDTVSLTYEATPTVRGEYYWEKTSVRYWSLLHLLVFYKDFPLANTVKVYPDIRDVSRYYLLSRIDRLSAMGIRTVRQKGASREFESMRDYVRGDDWREIHWKATAHRGKLTVKNYEAEKNQRLILAIDTGRLMSTMVRGSSKLDHAISSALVLAATAIAHSDRVGVCLFSNRVHQFIPPEKHERHIHTITEALYDAEYDYSETNNLRCLNYLAVKERKRALIVMLSDFADIDTSEEMVTGILNSARKNLFLYVGVRDPFIQAIVRQAPRDTVSAYHKAVAIGLENDREVVLEKLRHHGVHCLDCEPDQITAPVINKYLELTQLGAL